MPEATPPTGAPAAPAAGTAGAPPVDPRTDLPGFGDLPVVAELAPGLHRVIAPNPSPLTLDGTNTYVHGRAGSGVVVIVDPGPWTTDPGPQGPASSLAHRDRVETVVRDRDAQVAAIVVTHHHLDHSEAASAWAAHFGCTVVASSQAVAGPGGIVVGDGAEVGPDGARLIAMTTPGHCADHLAFRLPDGGLLVGDHVLGRGTSVVAFPDGDLLEYLDSLDKVLALGPDALHPGHGPSMVSDPSAVLDYYRHHRAFRERQVVDVLAAGPATPRDVVEVVYASHSPSVWAAAESSTRATLAKLASEGRVDLRADMARLVPLGDHSVAESASLDNQPSDRSAVGMQSEPTDAHKDRP